MTDRTLTWREPRWLWTGLAWLFAGPLNPAFFFGWVLALAWTQGELFSDAAAVAGVWNFLIIVVTAPSVIGATIMTWLYICEPAEKSWQFGPAGQAILCTWFIYPVVLSFYIFYRTGGFAPMGNPAILLYGPVAGWLVGTLVAPVAGLAGWLVFERTAFHRKAYSTGDAQI